MKKGDDVQLKADEKKRGRVKAVSGSNVTWQTANGATRTDKESELEPDTRSGKARMAAYQPDAMELVANVVGFGITQAVRKRKVMSEPTYRFALEDALYEFFLKRWMQENIESLITENHREVLSGEAADNFTSQDVYDALLKTLSIGILDCVYKLAKTRGLNMSTTWYLFQVASSFYMANLAQRQFRRDEDLGFKPQ